MNTLVLKKPKVCCLPASLQTPHLSTENVHFNDRFTVTLVKLYFNFTSLNTSVATLQWVFPTSTKVNDSQASRSKLLR